MKRLALILIAGLFIHNLHAQMEVPAAQAMFIYNFSRLTEWPASYKTGPFIIGVLGNSSIIRELKNYTQGKKVGTQSIVIKQYTEVGEIQQCHMLFITYGKTKYMAELNKTLANKHTLLIAERRGALEQGAAINFVLVDERLKFEFSPTNSTRSGIKYSSKLSEMAYNSN